jgi:DNA-binding helix-hairpin-helix protein with protein kinase domain
MNVTLEEDRHDKTGRHGKGDRHDKIEEYLDVPFASGAQGELYFSKDKLSVIKLYHTNVPNWTPTVEDARRMVLRKIIEEFNITRDDPAARDLFAWPNAIVKAPRLGVRMSNVNARLEHKPLSWWIGQRAVKRLPDDIRGNWLDRTRVASNMARIAWKLHGSGLCHSDFSSDNFLVNVNRQHVVLIDLDSLVVPSVLPPEIIGTGDYMAPEIVIGHARRDTTIRPSIYTDLHSLAVLIYQLLLMRHPLKGPKQHTTDPETDDILALGEKALYVEDPEDRSNRPAEPFNGAWLLGDEVDALMRRAFTGGLRGPHSRPLAAEWGDALIRMADQIIPCGNEACPGKAFVLLKDRPAICPWCQTKVPRPARVPIFRLYTGVGQAGHYQPDKGRIVGWQARTLHRWHVQTGISERSASKEERAPVAEIQYKQGQWLLTNHSIDGLRVATSGTVRQVERGNAAPLEHGQQVLLGAGPASRLALVTMQEL